MIFVDKKVLNLSRHIPVGLTVYEFLTELNEKQLNEMQEMVNEVKLRLKRDIYFREELDDLIDSLAYYRWEFNECYDDGGENLWYVCKDYTFEGKGIILHRSIPEDTWTIQFESLLQKYDTHPGDTRHYLKNIDGYVINEEDVNAAVIHAEKYIRENKDVLERI
jgi:hypothetical protein